MLIKGKEELRRRGEILEEFSKGKRPIKEKESVRWCEMIKGLFLEFKVKQE